MNLNEVRRTAKNLKEILIASTALYIVSIWEHLPGINPSHYSDISSVFWREGIGQGAHLIPYLQFMFEYPVIVGLLVHVCSSVRLYIPDFSSAMTVYVFLMDAILYFFAMGTIITLYKVVEKARGQVSRIWKCFLVAPSFVMFVTFNWDIIAIFFSTLALYFFLKDDRTKADISLGLGISAKLYPCMLIPVFMLEEHSWRRRFRRVITPISVFFLMNSPFLILNFSQWFETVKYHSAWGIEDSWLIFLFPDQMDPNAHYVGLAVLIYLVYKGLSTSSKREYGSLSERVITRGFLMYVAWLFGNYVVTPQMALILLPFYVLIPSIPLAAIFTAEIFNALIIVLWFSPQFNFGNPLISTSPVQWFAAARQFIWLGLFTFIIYPEKMREWTSKLLSRMGE